MMTTDRFFTLFLEELKTLPELSHYYKFLTSEKDFEFRKNYFMQRLDYIAYQVKQYINGGHSVPSIWDCGCGYGTTCLFLAMNGIKTYGSTLEFYFPFIENRKKYWSAYGDARLFEAGYEDIYDNHPTKNSIDIVIVQDTLHHLEPIDKALQIFNTSMKPNSVMICIEENGSNLIQTAKLYKQRGSNRVITFWDETLQKEITMGNENIRSMADWETLLSKNGFTVKASETNYIRVLPPYFYKNKKAQDLAEKEKIMANAFLKKYFYFGINFIAVKN
jgi:SAM-dependent methyltransferase